LSPNFEIAKILVCCSEIIMKIATSYLLILTCLLFPLISVSAQKTADKPTFKVEYEKFTLANGLDVIFHVDRSDPVVAVNLTAHVGSARQKISA